MQTQVQYLLGKVAEECCEVAQRAIKAQRFGLAEVQAGKDMNNAERLLDEYLDLKAVLELLEESGHITFPSAYELRRRLEEKRAKVFKYLAYSHSLGQVE